MNKEIFTKALEYAELGYEVFPVAPGKKHPITKNGCNDATTEKLQIEQWIKQYPNANIGIKAGEKVLILDIDNKDGKEGTKDIQEISEVLGKLPDRPGVRTPTGGYHLYFKHPGVVVVGQAGVVWKGRKTGIDIRVGNQYIVAPPSIHPDSGTAYKWSKGLRVNNLLN